ncbi:MAG: GTPase Era [Bacteroidetes bacterium]|nr:GTPase Era [Bacteroidota bacterium]
MTHKAGFVNIIGFPNVGKSTLMNALVGEKLSIITNKVQTTRHRILGILSDTNYQIVFSDTPGILKPHYKLHQSMMKSVNEAMQDADIFLFITTPADKNELEGLPEKLRETKIPVIVVINKIDLSNQVVVEEEMQRWQALLPEAEVIPVSALLKFNIEKVLQTLLDKLPESPAYYPKDTLTDKTMRFFVSEIIREKILLNYQKEIPYSTEVIIDEYKEDSDILRISAWIYVARESQKGIILGRQGHAIKKTGTEARKDIEDFTGKKVYLNLRVKVAKDWRDDERQLKWFGYD